MTVWATPKGFNFRATLPYVTDGTNEQFVGATQAYPTISTIGGDSVTYGWTTTTANVSGRDRINTGDTRLAGGCFGVPGTISTFQIALPATGVFLIRLAMGDQVNDQTMTYTVRDGATVLASKSATQANPFFDATGTNLSAAHWVTDNQPITPTMAGTMLTIDLGDPSDPTWSGWVSHVQVTQTGVVVKGVVRVIPAFAGNGVACLQQPVIQDQDALSMDMATPGTVWTAALTSGSGALIGTTTATTDASGRAAFTNLGFSTTGAKTVTFTSPGLTSCSSTITVDTATNAAQLDYLTQPDGYTSESALVTQPVVRALDYTGAFVASFTGVVTLTPTAQSSQFYTTTDLVKTTHTVQAGSTSTAVNVSPALTFPASQPANYTNQRYAILFTSGLLAGVSRYLSGNASSTQVTPTVALGSAPANGNTCVIRSGTGFPTMAQTAVAGVATFSGLVLSGWRTTGFIATSPGLKPVISNLLAPTGTFDTCNGVTMPAELPRVTVDASAPAITDPTPFSIDPTNNDITPNFKTWGSAITWLAANDSTLSRKVRVRGGDYNEFVTLANRMPTGGWITFEWVSPTSGTNRAVPLLNMVGCPRITTRDNALGVLGCAAYTGGNVAHHYRFKNIDLNITAPTDPAMEVFQLAALWDGVATTLAGMPHHIGFDGCMARGTSTTELRRAFFLGCKEFYFVNGTVADVHETTNGDTQAFAVSGTCAGPLRVQNSDIQAAGEIIISGGGDTPIAGLVCSDVQILYNHIWKPLAWKRVVPGVYVRGSTWETKNLLELKSGQRWQIEGNIFENEWEDAQDASVVLGSANQTGTSEWQGVRDITIRYNLFRNQCQWLIASGENEGSGGKGSVAIARRISVHDNLSFANNLTGTPFDKSPSPTPRQLVVANDIYSLWIRHNTILSLESGAGSGGAAFMEYDINVAVGPDCAFDFNIASFPYYGTTGGTGVGFMGAMFTNGFLSGANKNVLLDLNAAQAGPFSNYDQSWGNSTFAGVGFTLPSISATVDTATYDALAAALTLRSGLGGSLYNAAHGFAQDGKDAGANMLALRIAIAGVDTGGTSATTPAGTSRSRAARMDETGFGVFTNRNHRR